MSNSLSLLPRMRRPGPSAGARNRFLGTIERLEARHLLSRVDVPTAVDLRPGAGPNDTLDMALDLGHLNATPSVQVDGGIGDGDAGPADVDWYRFQLDRPAHVRLTATGQQRTDEPPAVVLGLYNSSGRGDFFTPLGHRLLAQSDDGRPSVARDLGPGTYYVALSGQGNRFFNPFLAGSGLDGTTGDYRLQATAADLDQDPEDGPVVLAVDRDGAHASSPLVIRIDVSSPLASESVAALSTDSIELGSTVRLLYDALGEFGDGADGEVFLGGFHFSLAAQELQLVPAAPLPPGWYQLELAGDRGAGRPVLTDPFGTPLGKDADHPDGRDFTTTFHVGREGRLGPDAGADDIAPLAHDLGALSTELLVQVIGAIGDDPFYAPTDEEVPLTPASDVDLYHFRISGPGRYALFADVFAGRIGSPLDPGVSLFVLDPKTGELAFRAGNNNIQNQLRDPVHDLRPLYTDAALSAGLTEGDYYVAVAHGLNTTSPAELQEPGVEGRFDPNVSHSGRAGANTGLYVLNLLIQPDHTRPQVTATSPTAGETLTGPPTELIVSFNESVNLWPLAFHSFAQTNRETVAAVFVAGPDGTRYFPRLLSYDEAIGEARFLMLDGLADGEYRLHLSGPLGLKDWADNPLEGNDPDGDYVVAFAVAGASRGADGDSPSRTSPTAADDPALVQELGILFPHDLQDGVTIARVAAPPGADGPMSTVDAYRFQVIQRHTYAFILDGINRRGSFSLTLLDAAGATVPVGMREDSSVLVLQASLEPGTYVLQVDPAASGPAASDDYQIHLRLMISNNLGNPPPLVAGPRPALQVRLGRDQSSSRPTSVGEPDLPPPIIEVQPALVPDLAEVVRPSFERPAITPLIATPPGAPTGAPITPALVFSDPLPGDVAAPHPGPSIILVSLPATPPEFGASPLAPTDLPDVTPVASSPAALAPGARAGSFLPAGTLLELAVRPHDGASGTSPSSAPVLAGQPAIRSPEMPRLMVAVAAQLSFFMPPLIAGDPEAKPAPKRSGPDVANAGPPGSEEAQAESPAADATPPAGEGSPGPAAARSQRVPVRIPDELLALLARGPVAPAEPPASSAAAGRRIGAGDREGRTEATPSSSPTDEVLATEDGAGRILVELGLCCAALAGLGIAARAYGRRLNAPPLPTAGRPGDDSRRWAGGLA